jgi:hypothetical protein
VHSFSLITVSKEISVNLHMLSAVKRHLPRLDRKRVLEPHRMRGLLQAMYASSGQSENAGTAARVVLCTKELQELQPLHSLPPTVNSIQLIQNQKNVQDHLHLSQRQNQNQRRRSPMSIMDKIARTDGVPPSTPSHWTNEALLQLFLLIPSLRTAPMLRAIQIRFQSPLDQCLLSPHVNRPISHPRQHQEIPLRLRLHPSQVPLCTPHSPQSHLYLHQNPHSRHLLLIGVNTLIPMLTLTFPSANSLLKDVAHWGSVAVLAILSQ